MNMAQQQVAGAIILDQLRDRIVTGLYLGRWEPGERLPSIRDVAGVENVDRKTAAAAYRRLQQEGLVRVRPRSGVYLRDQAIPAHGGPLERLYRRWLENVYEGARDLGLDTQTILRLITAVAEVEQRRVPVLDEDWSQAESVAHELRERLAIKAVPYLIDEVRHDASILGVAPFVVTTPYHRSTLSGMNGVIVETTLAKRTFKELRKRAREGRVLIVVPSEAVARRVGRALEQGQLLTQGADTEVRLGTNREALLAAAAAAHCIFVWPGTARWVAQELRDYDCLIPAHTLSNNTIVRVRQALLDAAIRQVAQTGALSAAPQPPRAAIAAINNTTSDGARVKTVVGDA
jgi:GntR family transcriptional regulator